jgi:hypothetical protein
LQLSANLFHLGQRKRSELSRRVKLLFQAIEDKAVGFTVFLIWKEDTSLDKSMQLHRNHKVNDCFSVRRSQSQKMLLSF